jgi:hypothetical protein
MLALKPLPDFLLIIVEAGGMMGQVRQLISMGKIKLRK